jgi:hypothetical protein
MRGCSVRERERVREGLAGSVGWRAAGGGVGTF